MVHGFGPKEEEKKYGNLFEKKSEKKVEKQKSISSENTYTNALTVKSNSFKENESVDLNSSDFWGKQAPEINPYASLSKLSGNRDSFVYGTNQNFNEKKRISENFQSSPYSYQYQPNYHQEDKENVFELQTKTLFLLKMEELWNLKIIEKQPKKITALNLFSADINYSQTYLLGQYVAQELSKVETGSENSIKKHIFNNISKKIIEFLETVFHARGVCEPTRIDNNDQCIEFVIILQHCNNRGKQNTYFKKEQSENQIFGGTLFDNTLKIKLKVKSPSIFQGFRFLGLLETFWVISPSGCSIFMMEVMKRLAMARLKEVKLVLCPKLSETGIGKNEKKSKNDYYYSEDKDKDIDIDKDSVLTSDDKTTLENEEEISSILDQSSFLVNTAESSFMKKIEPSEINRSPFQEKNEQQYLSYTKGISTTLNSEKQEQHPKITKSLNNSRESTNSQYMALTKKNLKKILPVAKHYKVEKDLYIGFNRTMIKQLKLKNKQVQKLKLSNKALFDWEKDNFNFQGFEVVEFVKLIFLQTHFKKLIFKHSEKKIESGEGNGVVTSVKILVDEFEIARCRCSSIFVQNIKEFLALVFLRMTCKDLFQQLFHCIIGSSGRQN